MAYAKEIIYSYFIIFITFIVGTFAIGGYLLACDKIDIAVFGGLLVSAGVVAGGVCTAMSNNIKYVQGIVCPFGIYPDCEPGRFALSRGYSTSVTFGGVNGATGGIIPPKPPSGG